MNYSSVRVPPDGAGKRIYTNEQIVSGNTVQIQCVNVVSVDDPTHAAKIDHNGSSYTRFVDGDPIMGSYGEQKVLQDTIIGVYEHTIDAYDDLFYIQTVNSGTSTYDNNLSIVKLEVTNNSTSRCCRTTNRHHYYQPGISVMAIISVSCGDNGKLNNKRQWGLFSDSNGFFFELSGSTLCIGSRSNITGDIIDTKVIQNDWNVDKLDGTGQSGIDINLTNSYQYFIIYNWPSGTVSYGIQDSSLGRIICHKIFNSGTSPYSSIRIGSLPIRFNNENYGVVSGGSQLNEIMAVVKSESRDPMYTFWRFGDLNCTNKTVINNTPILSLRPKVLLDNGGYNRINSYPETLSVFCTGSTIKIQMVVHDGTILTGDSWSMDSIGGPLQADSGATFIDINSDKFWVMSTFYVTKDVATNIDLRPFFELNDEGILLAGDSSTQSTISFVGTILNGTGASVTADFSYRSLY